MKSISTKDLVIGIVIGAVLSFIITYNNVGVVFPSEKGNFISFSKFYEYEKGIAPASAADSIIDNYQPGENAPFGETTKYFLMDSIHLLRMLIKEETQAHYLKIFLGKYLDKEEYTFFFTAATERGEDIFLYQKPDGTFGTTVRVTDPVSTISRDSLFYMDEILPCPGAGCPNDE